MIVALIAHDRQKDDIQAFCVRHRALLERFELIATGTNLATAVLVLRGIADATT